MLRVFLRKTKSAGVLLKNFLKTLYFSKKSNFYFVSFPKSGRTWVRFFLATYFKEKYEIPLDLEFRTNLRCVPTIFFTHASFDSVTFGKIFRSIKRAKNKKVIFLVRDPRDVVVSLYFHELKREKRIHPETTMSDFIRHPEFGVERIILFINTWYANKHSSKDFLLVSYESLRQNTPKVFQEMLFYLGENLIDKNAFNVALQESDFKSMQNKEVSGKFENWRLQTKDVSNPDSFKVRRGKIAGYFDYFSKEDIDYTDGLMQKLHPDIKNFIFSKQ